LIIPINLRPEHSESATNVVRVPDAKKFFKKADFSHSIKVSFFTGFRIALAISFRLLRAGD